MRLSSLLSMLCLALLVPAAHAQNCTYTSSSAQIIQGTQYRYDNQSLATPIYSTGCVASSGIIAIGSSSAGTSVQINNRISGGSSHSTASGVGGQTTVNNQNNNSLNQSQGQNQGLGQQLTGGTTTVSGPGTAKPPVCPAPEITPPVITPPVITSPVVTPPVITTPVTTPVITPPVQQPPRFTPTNPPGQPFPGVGAGTDQNPPHPTGTGGSYVGPVNLNS